MLSRSLYKPLITFFKHSGVPFFLSPKKVSTESSTDSLLSVHLESFKYSACCSSLYGSNCGRYLVTTHKKLDVSKLVLVSSTFGSCYIKKNLEKLVGAVPGQGVPLSISFRNYSTVPVSLCGKRVFIYNGKLFMPVVIKQSLLGMSFKHLVRCKRLGRVIHAKSTLLISRNKKKK